MIGCCIGKNIILNKKPENGVGLVCPKGIWLCKASLETDLRM
jgi:hypothetical protein